MAHHPYRTPLATRTAWWLPAALGIVTAGSAAQAQVMEDVELKREGADAVVVVRFNVPVQYRRAIAARGAEMPMATLGQAVAQCCAIRRAVGEDVDQPRLCRLTGQTLVERLLAATVPNGQLHRGIMRQAIGVVLRGVGDVRVEAGDGIAQASEQEHIRVGVALNRGAARRDVRPVGGRVAERVEPFERGFFDVRLGHARRHRR